MDRRNFLKRSVQKTAQRAMESVEARVNERARRWIRPPFAVAELDFLLNCTRCGDCIEACPHDVIFALKAGLGADVAGTPALDLTHKACQLCEDWSCVTACKAGALVLVESNDKTKPLPHLARASIDTTTCLPYKGPECGACEDSCPVEGALTWNTYLPNISQELCIGCGQCRHACVLQPSAISIDSRV